MNFCNQCGKAVSHKIPEGDDRKRFVCDKCGIVHYQNPLVVTGCLPVAEDGRILLCRRAIAPRRNYWTLPAGFLEKNETTAEGALRETMEEACAEVSINGLYRVYDLPHISQVYMFFLGDLQGSYAPGAESLEVELFSEESVPWNRIAFPVVTKALKDYFAEQRLGQFSFHMHQVVIPSP